MAACLPHSRVRLLTAALLCAVMGCQSAAKHQLSALTHFDSGSPEQAIASLNRAAEARNAEQQVIAADRALATLMAGDPATCEAGLRQVRNRLDYLRQKDLKEQTVAVLTDDKAVAWTGREFEQRMLDSILILTSLLGNRQDAHAYATQAMEQLVHDRQDLQPEAPDTDTTTAGHIREISPPNAPARLAANAFAAWLHAAVHSENAMDGDLTDRSLKLVSYWKGSSELEQEYPAIGTNTRKGHGALHVITFVGRITDWKTEYAEPTSTALLIADRLLSAAGDHTLPPTVAPVKIARPVQGSCSSPLVTAAGVRGLTDGSMTGNTLLDLNRTAWASYQNDRDEQIARAVVRRIVKKGTVYAAKDQLEVSNNSGLDLLMNVGGIAWEALEKPDTRHLSLLPEQIEVLQVELPAGQHEVDLSVVPNSAPKKQVPPAVSIPVRIDDGRNSFVLCYRTEGKITKIVSDSDTQ